MATAAAVRPASAAAASPDGRPCGTRAARSNGSAATSNAGSAPGASASWRPSSASATCSSTSATFGPPPGLKFAREFVGLNEGDEVEFELAESARQKGTPEAIDLVVLTPRNPGLRAVGAPPVERSTPTPRQGWTGGVGGSRAARRVPIDGRRPDGRRPDGRRRRRRRPRSEPPPPPWRSGTASLAAHRAAPRRRIGRVPRRRWAPRRGRPPRVPLALTPRRATSPGASDPEAEPNPTRTRVLPPGPSPPAPSVRRGAGHLRPAPASASDAHEAGPARGDARRGDAEQAEVARQSRPKPNSQRDPAALIAINKAMNHGEPRLRGGLRGPLPPDRAPGHAASQTYGILVKACSRARPVQLDRARHYFDLALSDGLNSNVVMYSSMINVLAQCHLVEEAKEVFEKMQAAGLQPNVITYSSVIHAMASRGMAEDAMELFDQMVRRGLTPNVITYNSLIHAMAKKGMIREARALLDVMKKFGTRRSSSTR